METKVIIEITTIKDYRTPAQRRMAWKPRDYDPETDPYKDVPLPKPPPIMPHMIGKNAVPKGMKFRQKEYGESR